LAGRKPFQFRQFTADQVLHNPSTYYGNNGTIHQPLQIGDLPAKYRNVQNLYQCIMKDIMPNRNRLAGSAKLADELLIYKNNPIHICSRHDFCQYH